MSYMTQRNNTFDIARGIAILGMIYGHAIAEMHHFDWMFNWFWSFHMPMFAIVAGYFYREKPFLQTFWSSVKTLMLPCLAISLILLLSDEITGGGKLLEINPVGMDIPYISSLYSPVCPLWVLVCSGIIQWSNDTCTHILVEV